MAAPVGLIVIILIILIVCLSLMLVISLEIKKGYDIWKTLQLNKPENRTEENLKKIFSKFKGSFYEKTIFDNIYPNTLALDAIGILNLIY